MLYLVTNNTAETLSEITTAVDAALSAPTTAIDRAISASGEQFTSAVLAAIAAWTREVCDDQKGADMLAAFARQFAEHEATIV